MTLLEFYKTGRFEIDRTTYGGSIHFLDFDGYGGIEDPKGIHTLSEVAKKIASDKSFDNMCRKQSESRDRQKKYKKNKGSV